MHASEYLWSAPTAIPDSGRSLSVEQTAPLVEEFAESNLFQAKVVRLDVDQNRAVREKYRIRNIPTLMVFKDGQLVGAWIGLSVGTSSRALCSRACRAA
jgi:thioredoxin-like negative regulator of GroEL